jgi:CRP-like cAMP-binding protein
MRTNVDSDWQEDECTQTRSDARALDPKLLLLRQVSLFEGLGEEARSALAAHATLKPYAKGALIVRKGDASRALLIVASGLVEVVLDSPGTEHVRLCEFRKGDYFGEMSLIDGAPRSATAIALEASEILEVDSEAVLAQLTTPMSRKLLKELASRVRRTDGTVIELADKVYRAAYANVNAAVRIELDTVKTLYQRTEQVSHRTLEQAEQRAEATVTDANRIVAGVQARIDSAMALLTKRIAPVVSVVALVLGALGVNSYLDLHAKYKEALGWHDQMGKFQDRVRSADKSLRVISETMTDLRSAREAASLHAPVQTSAELRRAALDFEHAKSELFERYIASPEHGVRYEQFDAEVIFEAVDTFVELAAWGRVDGLPSLSHAERLQLLGALGFVVRTLNDVNDAAMSGGQSLLDRKLRDTFYQLAERTDGTDRKQLQDGLERIIDRPASSRARDNAALISASLYPKATRAVRTVLAGMMNDTRVWRAATGAIALAGLRDGAAWKRIKRALDDPSAHYAYAYAALLAQEGQGPLRKLAEALGDGPRLAALVTRMQAAIQNHPPRNCYEERYDKWLTQCLDGKCGAPETGPIGGDCTLKGG